MNVEYEHENERRRDVQPFVRSHAEGCFSDLVRLELLAGCSI